MPPINPLTVQLLQAADFRKAFVALWCQAVGLTVANAWSRTSSLEKIRDEALKIRTALECSETLGTVDSLHPLALLMALDEWLYLTRSIENLSRSYTYKVRLDSSDYWLVPSVQNSFGEHALARQPSNVVAWVKYHFVIPARLASGMQVTLSTTAGADLEAWTQLSAGDSLRAYLAHFVDVADVDYRIDKSRMRLQVTAVTPRVARLKSLDDVLMNAAKNVAQVLVFPEFTVDLAGRDHLKAALRSRYMRKLPTPLLTVAGSFHESNHSQGPEKHAVQSFNTAPVLDRLGRVLWSHKKLRVLGDLGGLSEDVNEGSAVHVLVTPVGTHMVLICKDFLDRDQSVASLLQHVPVDWVWVPSYGNDKTMAEHLARADDVVRKSAACNVAVAQTENTMLAKEMKLGKPVAIPGFGWRALTNNEIAVPEGGGLVDFPLRPILSPSDRRSRFKVLGKPKGE
jgi:predicted amidohydrolase